MLKFLKVSHHGCDVCSRTDYSGQGWKQGYQLGGSAETSSRSFEKWLDSGYILKVESHSFLADWIQDDGKIGLSKKTAELQRMKLLAIILRQNPK